MFSAASQSNHKFWFSMRRLWGSRAANICRITRHGLYSYVWNLLGGNKYGFVLTSLSLCSSDTCSLERPVISRQSLKWRELESWLLKGGGGGSWKQRLTPSGENKRVSVTGGMSSQCVGPHIYYIMSTKIPIPLATGSSRQSGAILLGATTSKEC